MHHSPHQFFSVLFSRHLVATTCRKFNLRNPKPKTPRNPKPNILLLMSFVGFFSAPSIALVLDVLQLVDGDNDNSSNSNSCLVALRYFWRFGQMFYGSDLNPDTCLKYKAEIFLQKDLCLDGKHHVLGTVWGCS